MQISQGWYEQLTFDFIALSSGVGMADVIDCHNKVGIGVDEIGVWCEREIE